MIATIAILSRFRRIDLEEITACWCMRVSASCPQRGSASSNELAPWLDRQLELWVPGRSEADRFNSGNSCWSCSRIRPIHPVSRGRVRTASSNLPIRTKSRVDGANGRANRTWTTTNYREHSGKQKSEVSFTFMTFLNQMEILFTSFLISYFFFCYKYVHMYVWSVLNVYISTYYGVDINTLPIAYHWSCHLLTINLVGHGHVASVLAFAKHIRAYL